MGSKVRNNMQDQDLSEISSPIDTAIRKSQVRGLKVNTAGLSLMSNVQTCTEGMSPLMQRFTMNKMKH